MFIELERNILRSIETYNKPRDLSFKLCLKYKNLPKAAERKASSPPDFLNCVALTLTKLIIKTLNLKIKRHSKLFFKIKTRK